MPAILGFTSPFFPTIETLSTIMLRDFLWGGGNLERKPHLVRWELVCLSKKKGGLGVKCLSTFNKALLCKWNWRFANERGVLWNQVIRGKYGEERGGWCFREMREAYDVGLWKGIKMESDIVRTRISFSVGNGHRWDFGGISGVGILLCLCHFCPCLL